VVHLTDEQQVFSIRMNGVEKIKDADIREELFDFLEETYGKVRILEEKSMGKSRADVVMVTPNALYGIEIKSDADTYARLAGQVKDYDKYYDFNIVAVGTSHAAHIREHVPEHWGVITVEQEGEHLDFYILMQPLPNPKVKWEKKLEILWRPELALLQEQFQMPKYKDKSKDFVIKSMLSRCEYPEEKKGRIDLDELQRSVCDCLFERDYTKVEEVLKEYRKGEMQKRIENAEDPEEKKRLLQEKKKMAANLPVRKKRRRHRRIL